MPELPELLRNRTSINGNEDFSLLHLSRPIKEASESLRWHKYCSKSPRDLNFMEVIKWLLRRFVNYYQWVS